jgi:hypothetical protein
MPLPKTSILPQLQRARKAGRTLNQIVFLRSGKMATVSERASMSFKVMAMGQAKKSATSARGIARLSRFPRCTHTGN